MVYIAKQQLLTRIRRYKALNQMRLQHALSLMGHDARFCLSVVPVLLHYNHINLVGYRQHAPHGIDLFSTNQEQRLYLNRAISASATSLPEPENRAILAIYAMGSTSSLGQGAGSDLDLWVCTKVGLSADDLSILQDKCRLISSYFKSRGVELNLFVTPQDRFTNFQPDSLDEENCGSAQNFFLLDEFYRSSIRICGRYILWYLISSEEESADYHAYTQFLLKGITNIPHHILDPSAVAVSNDDPDLPINEGDNVQSSLESGTALSGAGLDLRVGVGKSDVGSGTSPSGNAEHAPSSVHLESLAKVQFQDSQHPHGPLVRALIHPGQVHVSELPDQSSDILSLYQPVDWHSWSKQYRQLEAQPSFASALHQADAQAVPAKVDADVLCGTDSAEDVQARAASGGTSGNVSRVDSCTELGGLDQEAFAQSRIDLTAYYSASENQTPVQHLATDLEFEPTTEFGLTSARINKQEGTKHHHSHLFHLHSTNADRGGHGFADSNLADINTFNNSIEVNYENEVGAEFSESDTAKIVRNQRAFAIGGSKIDSHESSSADVLHNPAAQRSPKQSTQAYLNNEDIVQSHALNPARVKESYALRQALSEQAKEGELPDNQNSSPSDPHDSWRQKYEASWSHAQYGEIAVEDFGPEVDDVVIARHQRLEQAALQAALNQESANASVEPATAQDPAGLLDKYSFEGSWNLSVMESGAQDQAEVSAQPRSGVELLSGVVSQHSLELGTTWLNAASQDSLQSADANIESEYNSARTELLNLNGVHGSSTTFSQDESNGEVSADIAGADASAILVHELADASDVLASESAADNGIIDATGIASDEGVLDTAAAPTSAVTVTSNSSHTNLALELLNIFYPEPQLSHVPEWGTFAATTATTTTEANAVGSISSLATGLSNGLAGGVTTATSANTGQKGAVQQGTATTEANAPAPATSAEAVQPEIDLADLNSADALNLPQLNWVYDKPEPATGGQGVSVPWFLSVHQIKLRLANHGFFKRWKLFNGNLSSGSGSNPSADQAIISYGYHSGYGRYELQIGLDLAQAKASGTQTAIDLLSAYPETIYTIYEADLDQALHIKVRIAQDKGSEQPSVGQSYFSYEVQPCISPRNVPAEETEAVESVEAADTIDGMSLTICSSETGSVPSTSAEVTAAVTAPAPQASINSTSIATNHAQAKAWDLAGDAASSTQGADSRINEGNTDLEVGTTNLDELAHTATTTTTTNTTTNNQLAETGVSVDSELVGGAEADTAANKVQKDFGHGLKAAFEGSFAPIPLWQLGGMHCVSTVDMVLDPELSSPQIAPQLTHVFPILGSSFTGYQQAMDGALLNEEYLKPSLISGLVDPQMVTQGSIAQRSSSVMLSANDPTLELVGFMALRPTDISLQDHSNYGLEALVEVSGAPSEAYAVSSWHLHHTTAQLAETLSQDALNLSKAVTKLSESKSAALPVALPSNLSVASVAALAADPSLLGSGLSPYAGGGLEEALRASLSVGLESLGGLGSVVRTTGVGAASLGTTVLGGAGSWSQIAPSGVNAAVDTSYLSLSELSHVTPLASLAALHTGSGKMVAGLPTQVAWQAQLMLQSQVSALNQLNQLNAQLGSLTAMWGQMGHAYLGGSWSTQVNAGAWRNLPQINTADGILGAFYKGEAYQRDSMFRLAPVQQALNHALLGEAWSNALNLEWGSLGSELSEAHLSLAQRWAEGIGLHHNALSMTEPYGIKPLHELCLNGEVLTESDANLAERSALFDHGSGTTIPSFGSNVVKVLGKLFAINSDHQDSGAVVAIMTPGLGAAKIQTISYSDVLKGRDLSNPHAGKLGESHGANADQDSLAGFASSPIAAGAIGAGVRAGTFAAGAAVADGSGSVWLHENDEASSASSSSLARNSERFRSLVHFPFANTSGENSPSLGLRIVEAVGATPMPFMGGMGLFGPFSSFMQQSENDFAEQSALAAKSLSSSELAESEDNDYASPEVSTTHPEDHVSFSEPEILGIAKNLPLGAIQDDSVRGSAYGMRGVVYEAANSGTSQRLDAASPLLASELRSTTLHIRSPHAKKRLHKPLASSPARSGSAYVGTAEINTETPVLHATEQKYPHKETVHSLPSRSLGRGTVSSLGSVSELANAAGLEEPSSGHNAWVEPSSPSIMVTNNQEQSGQDSFDGSGFAYDAYTHYTAQYQSTESSFANYGQAVLSVEHGALEPSAASGVHGAQSRRGILASSAIGASSSIFGTSGDTAAAPHSDNTAQINVAYGSSSVAHAAYATHYPHAVSQVAGIASVSDSDEPTATPLIGAHGLDLSKIHPHFKTQLHSKKGVVSTAISKRADPAYKNPSLSMGGGPVTGESTLDSNTGSAGAMGASSLGAAGVKLTSYPAHGSLAGTGSLGGKAPLHHAVTVRDDKGNTTVAEPFKPATGRNISQDKALGEDSAVLHMLQGNECVEAARLDQWQEFVAPLNEQEWFDFGSISKCSPTEYFGSGLWLLYKAIDSPFKVVLKILLMEAYASEYTHNRLLASELKDYMLSHEGYSLDLDAYYLMYLRVSQYLQRMEDPRLNLMQKCFYLKIFMGISQKRPHSNADYRLKRELLSRLSKRWGWSDNFVRQLERVDYWKMAQVREFYQEVYQALFASYQALLQFSVRHGIEYAITSDDAGILSRKLYAAFDLYPGKILVMHKSVSTSLEERSLTFIKPAKMSLCRRGWHLYTTYSEDLALLNMKAVYIGTRLCEVVTWATLNGLLSPRTTNYVVGAPSMVTPLKIKQLSNDVNRVLKPLLFRVSESSLQRTREMRGCIVILNLEQDPTVTLSNRRIDLESGSSLCSGRMRLCLVGSVDLVLINSWGEVRSISLPQGEAGVVELLATLLRIIGNSMEVYNEEASVQGQSQGQSAISSGSDSLGAAAQSTVESRNGRSVQGQQFSPSPNASSNLAAYVAPHYHSKAKVSAYGLSELRTESAASREAQMERSQSVNSEALSLGSLNGSTPAKEGGAQGIQGAQDSFSSQNISNQGSQNQELSQSGVGGQVANAVESQIEPDVVLAEQAELLTGKVVQDILHVASAEATDVVQSQGQDQDQGQSAAASVISNSMAASDSYNGVSASNSANPLASTEAAGGAGASGTTVAAGKDAVKPQGKRDGKQTSRIKSARSKDEPREHVDVNSILNSIEVCCYASAYSDLIKYDMELTLRQVVSCLSSSDSSEFIFDVGRNTYMARSDGRRGVMINCKRVFASEEFDMRVLSRYGMRPEYSMQVPAVVDRYATVGIVQYFFSPVPDKAKTWDIYIINERNEVSIYKKFEGSRASLVNAINRFYTSQTQINEQTLSHFNLPQYFVLSKDQTSLHPFTIRGVD